MKCVSGNRSWFKRLGVEIPSKMLETQFLDSYSNLVVIIYTPINFGVSYEKIEELNTFALYSDSHYLLDGLL